MPAERRRLEHLGLCGGKKLSGHSAPSLGAALYHAAGNELRKSGFGIGGGNVRAEWIPGDVMRTLLAAMMPANALALEVSMATGLRIGDVLAITRQQAARQRFTVTEEKTGKHRRVYLPRKLSERLFEQAGRFFAFEGRNDPKKHRTRAAVYKDLRRVARLYRLEGKKIAAHVSPHSARKIWAVDAAAKGRNVQRLLNHEDEAVTLLYSMADVLTQKRTGGKI